MGEGFPLSSNFILLFQTDSKEKSNAELKQRQQEIVKLVNEKSVQQAELNMLKDRLDKADQKYAEAQKNIKEAIVEFSKFRASSTEAITKEFHGWLLNIKKCIYLCKSVQKFSREDLGKAYV
jgi:regulator of replication initiation timing